jgi:hypothetical protein
LLSVYFTFLLQMYINTIFTSITTIYLFEIVLFVYEKSVCHQPLNTSYKF